MPRRALITGASSGIGRALALELAARGDDLLLLGRDEQRLQAVAAACTALGARAQTATVDVRDAEAMARIISAADAVAPFDLVIANAGISSGRPPGADLEPAGEGAAIVAINVVGVMSTIEPLLAAFIARKHGQIGIIGSIAGLIPLGDSPNYCASKAAVLSYGRALRDLLRPHGVGVTVVNAGYVETPMSARVLGWKPGLVTPDAAARIIVRALDRNRAVVSFPRWLALLARIGAVLPEILRRPFMLAFRFEMAPGGVASSQSSSSRSRT